MGSDDDNPPTGSGTSNTRTPEANATRNPRHNKQQAGRRTWTARKHQWQRHRRFPWRNDGDESICLRTADKRKSVPGNLSDAKALFQRHLQVGPSHAFPLLHQTEPTSDQNPGAEPIATGKVGPDGKKERTTFDEEMFRLDIKAYRTKLRELDHDLRRTV